MQIKINNVNYKSLNNISFEIEDNKITGILSNNMDDLNNIIDLFANNKYTGKIKYNLSKNKVGLVSIDNLHDMTYGTVSDFLNNNDIESEIYKMLDFDKTIINRELNTLSSTEKIKLLILKNINKDTIFINGILEELDSETKNIFTKLIINLKKFYNKTIIVSSIDIDNIYSFIDNLIIIHDSKCYSSNKYDIYNNEDILYNSFIQKPFIKEIENKILEKTNINLGNNENINELIKAIYREMR